MTFTQGMETADNGAMLRCVQGSLTSGTCKCGLGSRVADACEGLACKCPVTRKDGTAVRSGHDRSGQFVLLKSLFWNILRVSHLDARFCGRNWCLPTVSPFAIYILRIQSRKNDADGTTKTDIQTPIYNHPFHR